MSESKNKVVEILDTCVWQDLVNDEPSLLTKLLRLSQVRVVFFGVPTVVASEFRSNSSDILRKRTQWKKQIAALSRLAQQLDLEAAQSGRYKTEESRRRNVPLSQALTQMESEVDSFSGFPEQDIVHRFLTSDEVASIPSPKTITEDILAYGRDRKKPFGAKNGTADTELLLSVVHWAKRRKHRVRLHTSNYTDFSLGKDVKDTPHSDNFFAEDSNLEFCFGLRTLLNDYGKLNVDDYCLLHPNRCQACETPTEIEYMNCCRCDEELHTPFSASEFFVERVKNGFHIVVDGERRSCACGLKTFYGEFEKFCVDDRGPN